jgi:hypothetical protein
LQKFQKQKIERKKKKTHPQKQKKNPSFLLKKQRAHGGAGLVVVD